MRFLKGSLCTLAIIAGLVAMPAPVEATKVGSDASQDELSWRYGHRHHYYRGGYRHYRHYPRYRYYRHRPVIYRPYYYQRPLYYPAPYYYDPYYPRSGVYFQFRI